MGLSGFFILKLFLGCFLKYSVPSPLLKCLPVDTKFVRPQLQTLAIVGLHWNRELRNLSLLLRLIL